MGEFLAHAPVSRQGCITGARQPCFAVLLFVHDNGASFVWPRQLLAGLLLQGNTFSLN